MIALPDDARWGADALQHMLSTDQFAGLHSVVVESVIERLRASERFPTQREVYEWSHKRWPNHVSPIWRAAKLAEEAGEVAGAVIKMDEPEGRKTAADVRMETAQVVIVAMTLAEAMGFDLWEAVAEEFEQHRDSNQ